MVNPPKKIFNPSKAKAFTLLEVIIALVLSFFILGILYLSYNMMRSQFQNEYQKQLSKLVLLKSGLEVDFFYADTIIAEDQQLLAFRDGKVSAYQFQADAIIKIINQVSDTLFKGSCTPEFEREENHRWIKRLTLNIKTEEDEIQLSFTKKYLPNQKLKDKEVRFEY